MILEQLVLGVFLTLPAYFVGFYGTRAVRATGRGLSRLTLDTQFKDYPRTMRGKPVEPMNRVHLPKGGDGVFRSYPYRVESPKNRYTRNDYRAYNYNIYWK